MKAHATPPAAAAGPAAAAPRGGAPDTDALQAQLRLAAQAAGCSIALLARMPGPRAKAGAQPQILALHGLPTAAAPALAAALGRLSRRADAVAPPADAAPSPAAASACDLHAAFAADLPLPGGGDLGDAATWAARLVRGDERERIVLTLIDRQPRGSSCASQALRDAARVCEALLAGGPAPQPLPVDAPAADAPLLLDEQRWRYALDSAGLGVWDWDLDTGRMFYSSYWKRMLGYGDDEIGDSLEEWSHRVHPQDLPQVLESIRRHQDGRIDDYAISYRMLHRDGRVLWIEDRGCVVARHPDGSAQRLVGTQSDVTQQRALEATQRDRLAAEMASRSKSEFLSRMSHEMRTPLNAVIGFAQLLRLQPGARADYVDHVLHAAQQLLSLVDDVLDLQQVDEGRLKLEPQPLDATAVVIDCIALLEPLARSRDVRQSFAPTAGASTLRLLADPRRLRQALLNIGSNAIKYNRAGGDARWRAAHADDGRIAIEVEDGGDGMSSQEQLRLFHPFERLGREGGDTQGTGLGLLIARRLVEEMGGALELHSRQGVGTLVRLLLPAAPANGHAAGNNAASVPPAAKAPAAAAPPGALRVLYVEDNRVNALLFAEALRQHTPHLLRIAEDGDEAVELAREELPDVLVIDAHLPGSDGFAVLRRLRALPGLEAAPAFMCSADSLPDDLARARAAGFMGYWRKPLEIERVLADLQRICGARGE